MAGVAGLAAVPSLIAACSPAASTAPAASTGGAPSAAPSTGGGESPSAAAAAGNISVGSNHSDPGEKTGMEQINAAVPGSKLVKLEGAGHLSNLEQPAVFSKAIRDFFDLR